MDSRFLHIAMARLGTSIPIYCRPEFLAACRNEPDPQNGSRTVSPTLLNDSTIRFISFSGFCVAYPSFSFSFLHNAGTSHQKSSNFFPLFRYAAVCFLPLHAVFPPTLSLP